VSALGADVVHKAAELAPAILQRFPGGILFGGQLVVLAGFWSTGQADEVYVALLRHGSSAATRQPSTAQLIECP